MWERGIGGARSWASSMSSGPFVGGWVSVGDGAGWAILCDRTTFDLCGDDGALSRPGPPLATAWSAIMGSYDHFSSPQCTNKVRGAETGRARFGSEAVNCFSFLLRQAVRRRGASNGLSNVQCESSTLYLEKEVQDTVGKEATMARRMNKDEGGPVPVGLLGDWLSQKDSAPTCSCRRSKFSNKTSPLQCYCRGCLARTRAAPHRNATPGPAPQVNSTVDLRATVPLTVILATTHRGRLDDWRFEVFIISFTTMPQPISPVSFRGLDPGYAIYSKAQCQLKLWRSSRPATLRREPGDRECNRTRLGGSIDANWLFLAQHFATI